MDRLIASNSVPFGSADTAPGSGTPQYATDGNPATSTPATTWPAYAFNTIQDELMAIIIAAGITPDRTNWAQVLQAIRTLAPGTVGQMRGVAGSSAGAVTTASWTVKEIVAETALGGQTYKGANLSLSFNGSGTGAGGMDTGSMPTSADLSVYAIYDPTSGTWSTLGCAGSTSNGPVYSGSNMPSGYTASVLLWAGVTNSSKQFQKFTQRDRSIFVASTFVLNTGNATTWTAVSLAAIVPAAATEVSGTCGYTGTGQMEISADGSSVTGYQQGSAAAINFGAIVLSTAQTIYYQTTVSSSTAQISVSRYSF